LRYVATNSLLISIGFACQGGEETIGGTCHPHPLQELEGIIQKKKQEVSDAELQLKKIEHDMQTHAKEKTAASSFVANLEK